MSADEELCEDCGHCPSQDDALFAAIQMQSSSAARNEQRVALLYDERMELHVEGGASPHPERPDRIRAVMARLLSTGLGGDHNCIDVACEAESNLLYNSPPDHPSFDLQTVVNGYPVGRQRQRSWLPCTPRSLSRWWLISPTRALCKRGTLHQS
jgi:hypothetical protein